MPVSLDAFVPRTRRGTFCKVQQGNRKGFMDRDQAQSVPAGMCLTLVRLLHSRKEYTKPSSTRREDRYPYHHRFPRRGCYRLRLGGRGGDDPTNQAGEAYSGLAMLISAVSSWLWLSIAVALGMMTR